MKFAETVLSNSTRKLMVRNYQNAGCSLRKKFIVSFIIIFGALWFPISNSSSLVVLGGISGPTLFSLESFCLTTDRLVSNFRFFQFLLVFDFVRREEGHRTRKVVCHLSADQWTASAAAVWRQCRYHCWGELHRLLCNPNALVAVSKAVRAVKLCTNKILFSS